MDGNAERKKAAVGIDLKKPKGKKYELEQDIVFPTEHMRRIIEAAREGKTILEMPVFDGSETGEKVYNTLTVIGQVISPDKATDDAASGAPLLAGLKRWPVNISYFDRTKKSGEQLPVYSIGFELYENGVSRKLSLDYNDFVITGKMSQLDLKPITACGK